MKCPQQESKLWNERWYATAWSHRVLWHHIQSTSHHQHHHCWCYTLNEYLVCLEFNFETPLSTQNAKPPCLFFKSIHYTHLHISNNWPLSITPRYFGGFIDYSELLWFSHNIMTLSSFNQNVRISMEIKNNYKRFSYNRLNISKTCESVDQALNLEL